jgi:transglutaminase/protease-like cytokinesis protein 3
MVTQKAGFNGQCMCLYIKNGYLRYFSKIMRAPLAYSWFYTYHLYEEKMNLFLGTMNNAYFGLF